MTQPIPSTLPTSHLLYKKNLNINDLPPELFSKIISYLPSRNIPRLLGVCRQWQTRMKTSKTVIKPLQTMISQEIQKKKEVAIAQLENCEQTFRKDDYQHEGALLLPLFTSGIDRSKSTIQSIETTPLLDADTPTLFRSYRTADLEAGKVSSITAKTNCFSYLCTRTKVYICCLCVCVSAPIITGIVLLLL